MLEREVNHTVGLRGGLPEAVEVVEVAAAYLGAEGGDSFSGCVLTGQADDLMAVAQEFWDDGGGDVA